MLICKWSVCVCTCTNVNINQCMHAMCVWDCDGVFITQCDLKPFFYLSSWMSPNPFCSKWIWRQGQCWGLVIGNFDVSTQDRCKVVVHETGTLTIMIRSLLFLGDVYKRVCTSALCSNDYQQLWSQFGFWYNKTAHLGNRCSWSFRSVW